MDNENPISARLNKPPAIRSPLKTVKGHAGHRRQERGGHLKLPKIKGYSPPKGLAKVNPGYQREMMRLQLRNISGAAGADTEQQSLEAQIGQADQTIGQLDDVLTQYGLGTQEGL